jgi:hypothetical protein
MRSVKQLETLGEERDRLDAEAIHKVFQGLTLIRSTSKGFVNKLARETIVKIWQEPRMPNLRYTHNKPLDYPWSPLARDLFFNGETVGALVLEHVTPISHLCEEIFTKIAEEGCTNEDIYDLIMESHAPLSFTVITKKEDDLVTSAGLRSNLSGLEGAWARYTEALGLREEHFLAVTEDERYPAYVLEQIKQKQSLKDEKKAAKLKLLEV